MRTTPGQTPKARTGDRAGGRVVAIPQQTGLSVYLPVSPRVWFPSLRGATNPAASVAGLFLRPLSGQRTGAVPSAACAHEVRPQASGGDTAHKYKNGREALEPDMALPQPGGTTAKTVRRAEYRDGGGGGGVPLRRSLAHDSRERPATESQAKPRALSPPHLRGRTAGATGVGYQPGGRLALVVWGKRQQRPKGRSGWKPHTLTQKGHSDDDRKGNRPGRASPRIRGNAICHCRTAGFSHDHGAGQERDCGMTPDGISCALMRLSEAPNLAALRRVWDGLGAEYQRVPEVLAHKDAMKKALGVDDATRPPS